MNAEATYDCVRAETNLRDSAAGPAIFETFLMQLADLGIAPAIAPDDRLAAYRRIKESSGHTHRELGVALARTCGALLAVGGLPEPPTVALKLAA